MQRVYLSVLNVNMWHTESIDESTFEVVEQRAVFDVAVGLYTGGLPQCQHPGSAEFMTVRFALWYEE